MPSLQKILMNGLVSIDEFDDGGVQRRVDTYYDKMNLR